MNIGGLQKTSLTDYPGQISAIVFTQGCNLRCPYCYNHNLNAMENDEGNISEKEVLDFLEKRKGKLDAVVVTGGEPTLQESLKDFLTRVKEKGYAVKLDTNGTHPEKIEELYKGGLLDYIALDLKAPWEKYEKVVGVKIDTEKLRQTYNYVLNENIPHEFRTTLVPSLLSKEDISRMGEVIQGAQAWYLQRFMSEEDMIDNSLKHSSPYTHKEMAEMAEIGKQYVSECEYR